MPLSFWIDILYYLYAYFCTAFVVVFLACFQPAGMSMVKASSLDEKPAALPACGSSAKKPKNNTAMLKMMRCAIWYYYSKF